jgi:hypothetical protein
MRGVAAILAVMAVSLAVIAGAVFAGHDRSLLVSPPEVVAENFTRQITTGRFELALNLLSSGARATESAGSLKRRFAPLLRPAGAVNHVDAERLSLDAEQAGARATVRGDNGQAGLDYGLVRERGLWKIETLPGSR